MINVRTVPTNEALDIKKIKYGLLFNYKEIAIFKKILIKVPS